MESKMKSKLIRLAIAFGGAALIVIPFLLVNKTEDPHSGTAANSSSTDAAGASSAGIAPALPEIQGIDENLSPEQREMAMLEQHLTNAPAHGPVLLRLAELARQSGKIEDAAKYLKQLVEAEPSNEDARLELGRALFETGDIQGAIKETKALVEQNPKHVDGLYNLGAIYGNMGNSEEARRYFTMAVAADPVSEGAAKSKAALAQLASVSQSAPAPARSTGLLPVSQLPKVP